MAQDTLGSTDKKVKDKHLGILSIFLLTPLTAFASGQYVLTGLFIDLLVFIEFLVGVFKINLKWTGKLILTIVYIATMIILFYLIEQVDYLENMNLINVASALVPVTALYLTYLTIKTK